MNYYTLLVFLFFTRSLTAQKEDPIVGPQTIQFPNGYNVVYNEASYLWQEGLFINGKLSTGRIFQYNLLNEIDRIDYYQNGLESTLAINHSDTQPADISQKGKWLLHEKINPSPPTKKTCTPTTGTINTIDEHCKRQGHWIYYGKDRPESGIPAEGKIEEGNYINDRKEGIWTKYHNDGLTPKMVMEYSNNRPYGDFWKYDKTGKIIEKGTFLKNQFCDSLIRSHRNGQIEYEAWYNEYGKEDGVVNYYYPNGQLEFTFTAKNGVPIDTAKRFYENGELKEWILYDKEGLILKNELFETKKPVIAIQNHAPSPIEPIQTIGSPWNPNSFNKVLNINGEIWQEGTFKDGKLWDGKIYRFDQDGILLKVEIYKSGVYHSDGQLY